MALPLKDQSGHLFTIHVQDLTSFDHFEKPKKKQLEFKILDTALSFRLIVWRFRLSDMTVNEKIHLGSIPVFRTSDGVDRYGLMGRVTAAHCWATVP